MQAGIFISIRAQLELDRLILGLDANSAIKYKEECKYLEYDFNLIYRLCHANEQYSLCSSVDILAGGVYAAAKQLGWI